MCNQTNDQVSRRLRALSAHSASPDTGSHELALNHSTFPIVIKIGFAGSRVLINEDDRVDGAATSAEDAIELYLTERLIQLRQELELSDSHFFCGLSQIAVGCDMIFCRSCRNAGIPLRVLLPQHRSDYLAGMSASDSPDFSPQEREEAQTLLSSPHVIQEVVVNSTYDRRTRFEEVNEEIVRLSELLISLKREDSSDGRGGTQDLIAKAKFRGCALLEIQFCLKEGKMEFRETWHNREQFKLPRLPRFLGRVHFPVETRAVREATAANYCRALKEASSDVAKWRSRLFKTSAVTILGAHILATLCALVALINHEWRLAVWALAGELSLLCAGFAIHFYLHHAHAVKEWALSRLVAEIARSIEAVGGLHLYPEYFFLLPLPPVLRPLMRTIGVLHLWRTHFNQDPWQLKRDSYVDKRLTATKAQVPYYRNAAERARIGHNILHSGFNAFSAFAIVVATLEILLIVGALDIHEWRAHDAIEKSLASLAILLPILAVASISLSASLDLEARYHTFAEIREFLEQQVENLNNATSEREFVRLVLETESKLLGETANWYSRRSFTGIA